MNITLPRTELQAALNLIEATGWMEKGRPSYAVDPVDIACAESLRSRLAQPAQEKELQQPFAGAVVLLETIAQCGAQAFYEDGKPTQNRELCLHFAQEIRAALAAVELNLSEAKHRQPVEVDVVKELKALAQAVAEEPAATPRLVNAGRSAYRFLGRIVEKSASNDSKHLNNLLARIHRDGGHYQGQHGTDKAVADADLIVARLYGGEVEPAAWMNPNATYVKDAFIWHEDDCHPEFNAPVFTHHAPANQDAQAALIEAKNTILWLQRRLAKGYEADDIPHVKRCIAQIEAAIAGEKK